MPLYVNRDHEAPHTHATSNPSVINFILQTMGSEFRKYFGMTEIKRGHKRAGSLTYSEVCLADKITENPLVGLKLHYIK